MSFSKLDENVKPSVKTRFTRLFAIRNFRLLWFGENISVLGDQIFLVALPWLTLQLTGSGLALGTVLMSAAIPRALFMLVGGVASDRVGARRLMLLSNLGRVVLVSLLLGLIMLQMVQLWHLYLLAIGFGLADAFFYPAFNTILPALIEENQLETGNSVMQGTSQLMGLLGPTLGGFVIATLGLATAFGIDVASFGISILTLVLMAKSRFRLSEPAKSDSAAEELKPASPGVFTEIGQTLHYVRNDPLIRVLLIISAMVNFAVVGPFDVGSVALAGSRFGGGATALGILLSAVGVGGLVGAVLAGSLGQLPRRGHSVIIVCGLMGLCLMLMGIVPDLLLAALLMALIGCGGGFISIQAIAWLQSRTDPRQLGRVMSLVIFSSSGLAPLSLGLSGILADFSLTVLFVGAGLLLFIITIYAATQRTLRSY